MDTLTNPARILGLTGCLGDLGTINTLNIINSNWLFSNMYVLQGKNFMAKGKPQQTHMTA
jgi:hypothetical protein